MSKHDQERLPISLTTDTSKKNRLRKMFPGVKNIAWDDGGLTALMDASTGRRLQDGINTHFGPVKNIVDIGAGLGGSTLALSRVGHVTAIEKDQNRAYMLRHNMEVLNFTADILVGEYRLINFNDIPMDMIYIDLPWTRNDQTGVYVDGLPIEEVVEPLVGYAPVVVKVPLKYDAKRFQFFYRRMRIFEPYECQFVFLKSRV